MQIVVVDPSRTVRRTISTTVVDWGYSAVSACTGAEALAELARNEQARVLITSAELSDGSGLELCRSARTQIGSRRPLYILLMSSSEQREKVVAALESGADDFIAKPPASEELKARLRAADRVTSMQAALAQQAITDPLTGLLNRRGFFEHAGEVWKKTAQGKRVCAIILDIDRFKSINDNYGHGPGDDVLRAVANEARKKGRPVGRLGGEEFAILSDCALDDATAMAEVLRLTVERLVVHTNGQNICLTCSLGMAESEPGDTIDTLLRRADMALYEAKRQGRNRVVAADTYADLREHLDWRGIARTIPRRFGDRDELHPQAIP